MPILMIIASKNWHHEVIPLCILCEAVYVDAVVVNSMYVYFYLDLFKPKKSAIKKLSEISEKN